MLALVTDVGYIMKYQRSNFCAGRAESVKRRTYVTSNAVKPAELESMVELPLANEPIELGGSAVRFTVVSVALLEHVASNKPTIS